MYMHNDFFCYGLLEVTENLVSPPIQYTMESYS